MSRYERVYLVKGRTMCKHKTNTAMQVSEPGCLTDGLRPGELSGHILIVATSPTDRALICLLLRRWGAETAAVANCEHAVRALSDNAFDAILADVPLLQSSASALVEAGKQRSVRTAIVGLRDPDSEPGDVAECDAYLSKPINPEALLDVVGRCLGETDDQKTSVIDWDQLIGRLGDEDIIREVVDVYVDDNRERLSMLHAAVGDKDAQGIRTHAHALKGAAANLGAECLSEAAKHLEAAGRAGDLSGIEELVREVDRTFGEIGRASCRERVCHRV